MCTSSLGLHIPTFPPSHLQWVHPPWVYTSPPCLPPTYNGYILLGFTHPHLASLPLTMGTSSLGLHIPTLPPSHLQWVHPPWVYTSPPCLPPTYNGYILLGFTHPHLASLPLTMCTSSLGLHIPTFPPSHLQWVHPPWVYTSPPCLPPTYNGYILLGFTHPHLASLPLTMGTSSLGLHIPTLPPSHLQWVHPPWVYTSPPCLPPSYNGYILLGFTHPHLASLPLTICTSSLSLHIPTLPPSHLQWVHPPWVYTSPPCLPPTYNRYILLGFTHPHLASLPLTIGTSSLGLHSSTLPPSHSQWVHPPWVYTSPPCLPPTHNGYILLGFTQLHHEPDAVAWQQFPLIILSAVCILIIIKVLSATFLSHLHTTFLLHWLGLLQQAGWYW